MKTRVYKSQAFGDVYAPTSKSMAHRLLIAAALCPGMSRISGVTLCDDVLATLDCLCALGVECTISDSTVTVHGRDLRFAKPTAPLSCRESGSTLRFMLPLALLSGNECQLRGAKRLFERPMEIYEELCETRRFRYARGGETITVQGKLSGGDYALPGNISSQFITGLLFALSALREESRIRITTEIESRSYIELTRSAMAAFGVEVIWEDERTLLIRGGQAYSPKDISVEGDYSGAAFLEAFNLFGGDVRVLGLSDESLQGDRAYRKLFSMLREGTPVINIEDCPDLGPILFAVSAGLYGAEFIGTKRLKIKESDRAEAMAAELRKFGADITVSENSVKIKKSKLHPPHEVLSGHNDHRIVMALAVLCSVYGGEIEGCEAVKKSYPDFFRDIQRLGIDFESYEI